MPMVGRMCLVGRKPFCRGDLERMLSSVTVDRAQYGRHEIQNLDRNRSKSGLGVPRDPHLTGRFDEHGVRPLEARPRMNKADEADQLRAAHPWGI